MSESSHTILNVRESEVIAMKMYDKESQNLNKEIPQNTGNEFVIILEQWRKRKKRLRIYRYSLCVALFCFSILLGGVMYYQLYNQIPSVLRVKAGEGQVLDYQLPLVGEVVPASEGGVSNIPPDAIKIDLSKEVTLNTAKSNKYLMKVKLFGVIPFKQVNIQVISDQELIPVGEPIGLYVKTDGLLVIGVGEFKGTDGLTYSPAKYILRSGDYIKKINGTPINDKETFMEMVKESGGKSITLLIERNKQEMEVSIQPIKNEKGEYKLGIWIRDNAQGIGTMTYIDADGRFGALGHGVSDVDTSTLMNLEDGTLYQTEIISIQKGINGDPGELTGRIIYDKSKILGNIDYNGQEGIFGECYDEAGIMMDQDPLPIGLKQEIEIGEAQILCSVSGESEYYGIQITAVHLDNDNINKGIELRVTDSRLINLTGGIVQGMSGSPIIQNGKFIGAVTHVLVNDPTRGYGIFIENMLEH